MQAERTSTVVVTGAAGFLGSHICERFLKDGHRVLGIDNLRTGLRANVEFLASLPTGRERFCFVEADASEPWTSWLDRAPEAWMKDVPYVFHFASPASPPLYQRWPLETLAVNSVGLWSALDFATERGARVIFASTSEIYGDPAVSPQPETYFGNVNGIGPRACYDEAKRFGEALIVSYNQAKGTRHGFVRIFNTYGPRMNPDDGRVVVNFLRHAQLGQPLPVQGDGKQTRSFCYVDDLVEGLVRFAKSEEVGPINLGNDREFTILELVAAVQSLYPEKPLALRQLPAAIDDPKRRRPDLSLAKSKLGWSPTIELESGLRRMSEWLATQT